MLFQVNKKRWEQLPNFSIVIFHGIKGSLVMWCNLNVLSSFDYLNLWLESKEPRKNSKLWQFGLLALPPASPNYILSHWRNHHQDPALTSGHFVFNQSSCCNIIIASLAMLVLPGLQEQLSRKILGLQQEKEWEHPQCMNSVSCLTQYSLNEENCLLQKVCSKSSCCVPAIISSMNSCELFSKSVHVGRRL